MNIHEKEISELSNFIRKVQRSVGHVVGCITIFYILGTVRGFQYYWSLNDGLFLRYLPRLKMLQMKERDVCAIDNTNYDMNTTPPGAHPLDF